MKIMMPCCRRAGNRQQIKRSKEKIEEEEYAQDAGGKVRTARKFIDTEPVKSPAEVQAERCDQHQRVVGRRTRQRHPRGSPRCRRSHSGSYGALAHPKRLWVTISERIGKTTMPTVHAGCVEPDSAKPVRQQTRYRPADFGGQRVRRFMASGGEKKGDIPDESLCNQFRLQFTHEVALVSSVPVA